MLDGLGERGSLLKAHPPLPSRDWGPWECPHPQQGLWTVSVLGISGPQFPYQADPGDRRVIHSSARGHPGRCRCPSATGGPCPVASELPSLPRSVLSSANAGQRLPHGPHPKREPRPEATQGTLDWACHSSGHHKAQHGQGSPSEKSGAWGAKRQEGLRRRRGCGSRVDQVGFTGPCWPALGEHSRAAMPGPGYVPAGRGRGKPGGTLPPLEGWGTLNPARLPGRGIWAALSAE